MVSSPSAAGFTRAVERVVGRLVANDPAIGRGPQHRAAGLGAESDRHHAVGDRRRRAARRAARRVQLIMRIGGGPGGDAGELQVTVLPRITAPCRTHLRDAGAVGRGAVPAVDRRTHLGRHVEGVDDILHPDRKARAAAAGGGTVECARLRDCGIGIELTHARITLSWSSMRARQARTTASQVKVSAAMPRTISVAESSLRCGAGAVTRGGLPLRRRRRRHAPATSRRGRAMNFSTSPSIFGSNLFDALATRSTSTRLPACAW